MSAATRIRKPVVDQLCAEAVKLAQTAAEEAAGTEAIGDHLGAQADGERVVTHYFSCLLPAYRGWRWSVTVARAPRSRLVTVDEIVLLPGDEALLAPEWVPWSERLRPGDLGVGDLLPTKADDERLVPGYTGEDEIPPDAVDSDSWYAPSDAVAWELGLGRARVLSPFGRDEAAQRWYSGPHGPHVPIAQAAPARCSTCGFMVLLSGQLREMFGVCANEYAPSDGQVVSLDHGCGAHSEAAVMPATPKAAEPIVDEFQIERVVLHPEHGEASVEATTPSEELGHS